MQDPIEIKKLSLRLNSTKTEEKRKSNFSIVKSYAILFYYNPDRLCKNLRQVVEVIACLQENLCRIVRKNETEKLFGSAICTGGNSKLTAEMCLPSLETIVKDVKFWLF